MSSLSIDCSTEPVTCNSNFENRSRLHSTYLMDCMESTAKSALLRRAILAHTQTLGQKREEDARLSLRSSYSIRRSSAVRAWQSRRYGHNSGSVRDVTCHRHNCANMSPDSGCGSASLTCVDAVLSSAVVSVPYGFSHSVSVVGLTPLLSISTQILRTNAQLRSLSHMTK